MKNFGILIGLILAVSMILGACSGKKDDNIIVNELKLDSAHFVGRRQQDQLANVYTKEIVSGFFSDDTIRHYKLDNWSNIEYWDGDGGFLLFKDHTQGSKDGLRVKVSDLGQLNAEFLVSRDGAAKKEKEDAYNREHFDVARCSDKQIWDFVQGDWHGSDYPISGMAVYYKLSISNRHIIVKRYTYIEGQSDRYQDWNNAPFTTFLNCDFSGSISRENAASILEIHSSLEVKQTEDRAYLLLSGNCGEEFRLYVSNPAQTYKDAKKDLDVELHAHTVGWHAAFSRGRDF